METKKVCWESVNESREFPVSDIDFFRYESNVESFHSTNVAKRSAILRRKADSLPTYMHQRTYHHNGIYSFEIQQRYNCHVKFLTTTTSRIRGSSTDGTRQIFRDAHMQCR